VLQYKESTSPEVSVKLVKFAWTSGARLPRVSALFHFLTTALARFQFNPNGHLNHAITGYKWHLMRFIAFVIE
jgi:hypothetical protein